MPLFRFDADTPHSAWLDRYPGSVALLGPLPTGDDRSLGDLALRLGRSPADLLAAIAETCCCRAPVERDTDWPAAAIGEVVAQLADEHHPFLSAELGRLAVLLRRPAACSAGLAEAVRAWIDGKLAHMAQEERELFPLCRELERRPDAGGVAEAALRRMYQSHEQASAMLATICERLAGEAGDGRADGSLKPVLAGVVAVLERHIELEDTVLLPAVVHAGELIRLRLRRSLEVLRD